MAERKASGPLETPPCRRKADLGAGASVDQPSRPKLRRDVQSRAILAKEELLPERRTACKAKAAPSTRGDGEAAKAGEAQGKVKRSNTSDSERDRAVGASLQRGLTAHLDQTKKMDPTQGGKENKKQFEPEEQEEVESHQSDGEEDPQGDAEAIELARMKRANHARFMRFSRSLKSALASNTSNNGFEVLVGLAVSWVVHVS